jgi:hypothetical protein
LKLVGEILSVLPVTRYSDSKTGLLSTEFFGFLALFWVATLEQRIRACHLDPCGTNDGTSDRAKWPPFRSPRRQQPQTTLAYGAA